MILWVSVIMWLAARGQDTRPRVDNRIRERILKALAGPPGIGSTGRTLGPTPSERCQPALSTLLVSGRVADGVLRIHLLQSARRSAAVVEISWPARLMTTEPQHLQQTTAEVARILGAASRELARRAK